MIYILVGKSCSGKTTLAWALETLGCERIVTYTTRPKRPNEVDGVDYHFISEQLFKEKESLGFFMETASYEMTHGTVWYGSAKDDYKPLHRDKVIVLNPQGIQQLKEHVDDAPIYRERLEGMKIIFLDPPDEIRIDRAKQRGDSKEEIRQRYKVETYDTFLPMWKEPHMYDLLLQEEQYNPMSIAAWLMMWSAGKILYICDPDKNDTCSKDICYADGPDEMSCRLTAYVKHAKNFVYDDETDTYVEVG